jgi:hypothetical protein
MEKTGRNSIRLSVLDLPRPLELELKLGEITDHPDGSGDGIMEVDIDWVNIQEVLQEFVIDALMGGIDQSKKNQE